MIRIAAAPFIAIQRAQDSVRRSAVRRRLESIASGKSTDVAIDIDEPRVDVAGVLEEITAGMTADSIEVARLVASFKNTGTANQIVERLEARSVHHRTSAARAVGALHMYEAVPAVATLLMSRDHAVGDASARALGRIGGARSASALVATIQRRGVNRRLVSELARAAPDFYIEAALAEPQKSGVRPALAMAAGLRKRLTATSQLIALVESGSRRERVISCRALGWMGARTAAPAITEALSDPDWKIRMSAAKALGALGARSARDQIRQLYADRNARVRLAALQAVRRIDRVPATAQGDRSGA